MIGILTFSRCYNYGAFLQAYALQRFLIENGYDNELIDYRNQKSIHNELKTMFRHDGNTPVLYLKLLYKFMKFRYYHRKLKKTRHYLHREELGEKHYHTVIIGSDQIWCYTKEWGGVDTPYFSDQLSADKIIAYAASMGPDNFDRQHPRSIVRLMKNFDSIGVRDLNTFKFATSLNENTVRLVLDPTLIYNFDQEIKDVHFKNYILFYSDGLLPDDKIIQEMKALSREKGLQIISIGKKFDWADRNIIAPSPFRWMGFIKHADFVFTCMFHGLLFSMKFNKQFALFLIPERENKCLDFLRRVDLTGRVVREQSDMNRLLESKIDYLPVNEFLKKEQIVSASFLHENLKKNTL